MALDWYDVDDASAPVLLVIPVFNGATFMQNDWCEYFRARGWRSAVVVRQGNKGILGNLGMTSPKCWTIDGQQEIHYAVKNIQEKYPVAKIFLSGQSLGAYQAMRYLADGDRPHILGCMNLSLRTDFGMMQLYEMNPVVIRSILYESLGCMDRLPQKVRDQVINCEDLSDVFAHIFCPAAGFMHEDLEVRKTQFLSDSDYSHKLCDVKTPTLCMWSLQDPFFDQSHIERLYRELPENPCISCVTTNAGGHVVHYEGYDMQCWATKVGFEYCNAIYQAHLNGGKATNIELEELTQENCRRRSNSV
jgi:predicted alpha/beta-fold hydrolase